MSHLRTQIRDAVAKPSSASGVLYGLTTTQTRVYVGRTDPLPVDNGASLLVDVGEEQVETVAIGGAARARILERRLELVVRAGVKAVSGYLDTLDQIALEVEQALAGQQSLGQLCKAVQPIGFDAPEIDGQGEKTVAFLTMRFTVTYMAALNAPQTPR